MKNTKSTKFQQGSTPIFDIKVEPRWTRIFHKIKPYGKVLSLAGVLMALTIFHGLFLIATPAKASTVGVAPLNSLNSGLVGYWTFDGKDVAGGTIRDVSGQGKNGGAVNIASSTFFTTGKIGQAGNFDGTNDYVNADSIAASSFFTGAHSISVWGKLASWSANRTIIGAGTLSATGYSELDFSGTTKRFNCRTSDFPGASNDIASINTYDGDSSWHHFVWTVNASGHITGCYIDGVLQGTSASAPALTAINKFYIGQLPWSSSNTNVWNGKIDDVRVYNRALSAAEVTRLYKIGSISKVAVAPVTSLSSGLVGYWTFDGKDVAGGTIRDVSGQGNHGGAVSIATSTFYMAGKIGGAGNFDGVDDLVKPGNLFNFSSTGNFSASAWIKTAVGATIIVTDSWIATAANNGWVFYVDSSTKKLRFYAVVSAVNDFETGNTVVADGKWHHVSFTYNNKLVTFYVDGVADGGGTVSAIGSGTLSTATYGTLIGANFNTNNSSYINFFNGHLDETRVYNRALSTSEVTRLYQMGLPSISVAKMPLDLVPNASLAFSLRKLRSAYRGPAIRVLRSSDSAEADIGFVDAPLGKSLDTVALARFCSATDCTVKTWYDQSGNGRNATQATAGNQPTIVSSGSILVGSSTPARPTVLFDGGDYFTYTAITTPSAVSFTGTLKFNSYTTEQRIFSGAFGTAEWAVASTNVEGAGSAGKNRLSQIAVNNAYSSSSMGSGWVIPSSNSTGAGATQLFRKNGVPDGYTALTQAYSQPMSTLCYQNGVNDFCKAYISELYIYSTALATTSLQLLEKNQNAYYKVY